MAGKLDADMKLIEDFIKAGGEVEDAVSGQKLQAGDLASAAAPGADPAGAGDLKERQLALQERKQAFRESQAQGADEEPSAARAGLATFQDAAMQQAAAFGDWLGNAPTPGGIPAMIGMIMLLSFLVIPVKGVYTRAGLLWQTVRGKTYLKGSLRDPQNPSPGGAYYQETAAPAPAPASPAPGPNIARPLVADVDPFDFGSRLEIQ